MGLVWIAVAVAVFVLVSGVCYVLLRLVGLDSRPTNTPDQDLNEAEMLTHSKRPFT